MQLEHIKAHGWTNESNAIEELLSTARQGLIEVRRAVNALRPKSLGDLGFPDVIQHLLQSQVNRTGLAHHFELSGEWVPLNRNDEEHLFRITQEPVNNVLKHANADSITVEISNTLNEVCILISDNGSGFIVAPTDSIEQSGFGLHSMQQRANLIGADLKIVSSPGPCTQVFVSKARQ